MSEKIKRPNIPRCYLVELSSRRSVQIDESEIAKVKESLSSGQFVKVKQGIINPSFVVDITLDTKRMSDFRTELDRIEQHNKFNSMYNDSNYQRQYPEFRQLKDVFADVNMRLEKQRKPELPDNLT